MLSLCLNICGSLERRFNLIFKTALKVSETQLNVKLTKTYATELSQIVISSTAQPNQIGGSGKISCKIFKVKVTKNLCTKHKLFRKYLEVFKSYKLLYKHSWVVIFVLVLQIRPTWLGWTVSSN